MTASMVSPNAAAGKSGGPAPLPVSALPLPADDPEPEDDQPKHFDLPRNSSGELTPAQRARLGLDLDPSSDEPTAQSAATAPDQAPPAGQPLPPPSQPEAPRAQPQAASHPPASPPPAPPAAPAQQPQQAAAPAPAQQRPHPPPEPAQQQPGSSFDFRAMEMPDQAGPGPGDAVPQATTGEPRLAPVSKAPKLAPARQKQAPSERAATRPEEPAQQPRRQAPQRREVEDEFEHVRRDRNVLTYGFAWTAFCIVITGIIAFTSSMSGDPTATAGPGPLIPGLLSIAMGWVVVIAARAMGSGWWALMILPAAVLLAGPYVYKNVWAGSVEDAARSYLSTNGADILIDVDATSVISATKNTDRGCFAINRTRSNYDTEVAVVTYVPETARQQADHALAPRYAGRIEAGGDRAAYRVFTFKGGRAPAIVTTPSAAPLDCENSVSAPGSNAKREGPND
ncbi:MAG: hypothetical protein HZB14_07395 [Actinobacteria bacterium]|nr:hypothetical protein [Actinomycetota bacterium]